MRKTNSVGIKFFILLTFALGMLPGCVNTGGTLKIEGKVVDESTNAGIPWKNIVIQALTDDNKQTAIEAGLFSTDSSGNFTYTLSKIKGVYYYNFCFTGSPEYPVTITELSIAGIKRNARNLTFSLKKLVDLTINIYRKSRTPARDTLRLIWESDGVFGLSLYPYRIFNYAETSNSGGLVSGTELMWVGGNVNSTVKTKVFAEKKTELSWKLYRNGKKQEFTDTITCKRDFANSVYFSY